jgi:hypothetical protein
VEVRHSPTFSTHCISPQARLRFREVQGDAREREKSKRNAVCVTSSTLPAVFFSITGEILPKSTHILSPSFLSFVKGNPKKKTKLIGLNFALGLDRWARKLLEVPVSSPEIKKDSLNFWTFNWLTVRFG